VVPYFKGVVKYDALFFGLSSDLGLLMSQ